MTFHRRLTFAIVLSFVVLAGACSSSKSPNNNDAAPDAPSNCGVPASFAWSSTGPLLAPISDSNHNLVAVKDPSVVFYNDSWHVFTSTVDAGGNYNMAYFNFPDWDHTADATIYYLDQTAGLAGYHAAPQVFYFTPQNKWYLIYQSGPPQYSTNLDNPGNPAAWSPPGNFYGSEPAIVTANKGTTGGWLDFWIICDTANCYLFFSDDNGHWYRAQTTIADFPHGFGDPVIVLADDADPHRLFEASNVYYMKGTNKYLAVIEGFDADSGYKRYFRSWTADTLDGDWTPLQDTYAMPFASAANVTFTQQPAWTQNISHGELLRAGYDETLTIDTCNLQYLYQGYDPAAPTNPYNGIPWRIGLLTKTN